MRPVRPAISRCCWGRCWPPWLSRRQPVRLCANERGHMAENEKKPVAVPVPAATVLMIRDGASGLEVFMVKRHHQIDFVAGALVFPGGKTAPGDSDPGVAAMMDCHPDWDATMRALGAAAIREAFA